MWQFRNGQIDRGGRSSGRRFAARGATTVFALMALLLIFVQVALAANPAPLQVYYIPVDEDDALASMQAINNSSSYKAVDPVTTYVSIAIGATGTLVYFDQWENGYDTDIANPANLYSSSNLGGTQIWGNGLCADGVAPSKTGVVPACTTANQATVDALSAGQVILLRNDVVSTTRQAVIDFDGGDKIGATEQIAVTRVFWADNSDTLLAAAIELYPTNEWGTLYVAPVGTNDTQYGSGSDLMFEYTSFAVQAATNGTQVAVDADGPGAGAATTFTLNQGESRIVSGILRGGTVTATNGSVQAHLLTGDVYNTAASYGYSGYTLFPRSKWGSSYWSPASTQADPAPTQITAYNPADQGSAIFVRCEFRTGLSISSSTQSIPAGESRAWEVPYTSGAHCFAVTSATNNTPVAKPFFAISTTDSAEFGSQYGGRGWDWGITLVPDESLSPLALVGLGLGQDPNQTITENGSPIWVTPVCASTYLYVDFDGNGVADKVDVNGDGDVLDTNVDGINETTSNNGMLLTTLQSVRVYNPGATSNQTGAQLRTKTAANQAWGAGTLGCDIVVAWGEDPTRASLQVPGFDVGTTVPPLSGFTVNKTAAMATDADGDGVITPGDTITYTIDIKNTGLAPILSAYVTDTVPSNTTYVASSTQTNKTGAWTLLADVGGTTPLAQAGGYPFVWSTSTTPTALNPGESFSIRFRVVVKDTTSCSESVVNNVIVRTGNKTKTANATTSLDCPAKLTIVKQANGPSATFAFTTTAVPDVPALAAGMASFNLVPAANSSASKVFDKILARTYTVRESTLPTGWSFDDVACVNNGSAPVSTYTKTGGTRQVNVALVEDGDVTCTFVNIGPPTIVIKKVTVPAGSTQQFNFTTTNLPGGNFSLTGAAGGDTKSVQVLPGTAYNVAESVPTGWVQTSATCDNGNAASSITANAGQTVTCTFVNTLKGTLVVEKLTVPAGDATSFGFTSDVAGNTSFNLTGVPSVANTKAISVTPGAYNVTETGATNWTLTGLTCSDANSVANLGLGKATYNIEAGERVKCTFTNTRDTGQLEVRKVVVSPVNPDPGLFNLQIDGVTAGTGANAGHNGTTGKITKNTGSFTVGETAGTGTSLADYTQTSIVCKDGGGTGTTVASNTLSATLANVPVAKNSDVVCVITNTRKTGSLEVTKTVNWNGVTPEADTFEICILGPSYPTTANCQNITTAQVTAGTKLTWANLLPGSYTVSETGQPEWTTSVTGSPASVPANGGIVSASVTNTRKLGSLEVTKTVNWNGVTPEADTFEICITGPSYPTTANCQNITTAQVTAGQKLTWANLLPGSYTVSETGQAEWTTVVTGSPASVPANGGTVSASVTNTRKLGSLEVTKTVNWNGVTPEADTFEICITGPSYPTTANCKNITTTQITAGEKLTWSNLLPGNYTVAETGQAEWTTVVTGSPASVPANGGTVSASVTNTRKLGSLEVTKTVNWNGVTPEADTFEICILGPSYPTTANCQNITTAQVTAGTKLTWANLLPGSYTVTETGQAEWTTSVTGSPANVPTSGGTVAAGVTNTRKTGSIEIRKIGVGGNGTFAYTATGGAPVAPFDITTTGFVQSGSNSTGSKQFSNVPIGQYVFTESALPAGWDFTNLACTGDDNGLVDQSLRQATVNLDNGEAVICTYTNTKGLARIFFDTPTSTNAVNAAHNFTVTVETSIDNGTTWQPVNNQLVTGSLVAPVVGTLAAPGTCTTNAVGKCALIVNSTAAGVTTLNASANVDVLGESTPVSTSGSAGQFRNAAKTWVDLRISIAGTETNSVGSPHTFTVLAEQQIGNGAWVPVADGTHPVVTITPAGYSTESNSCLTAGTVNGACTVVINSSSAAVYNASASLTTQVAAQSITRATPADAVKTYADLRIKIGDTATNPLNQPHTFTVTVEKKVGAADWAPVAGAHPTVAITPSGFTAGDNTCTTPGTDSAGQCTVTINSDLANVYTAQASVTFPAADNQPLTRITGTPLNEDLGGSANAVKTYKEGALLISKTVTPTFNRTFDWTIVKDVEPATLDLFDGQSQSVTYTVKVTKSDPIDTGHAIAGSVTIKNTDAANPAIVNQPVDKLANGDTITLNCGVGAWPRTIPAGGQIACTYGPKLVAAVASTNYVTVTTTSNSVFTTTKEYAFATPTITTKDAITVTDSNTTTVFGPYSATASKKYSQDLSCTTQEMSDYSNGIATGSKSNTATIKYGATNGLSDAAVVDVSCYRLAVSKDAAPSLTRTWTWDIKKDVNTSIVHLFEDGTATLEYTVTVSNLGSEDSNRAATGSIVVRNPAPIAATLTTLADALPGATVGALTGTGCTEAPFTVLANSTLTCGYTATGFATTGVYTNTATAIAYGTSYTGTARIDFAAAQVTEVHPSIGVTDTNVVEPLGTGVTTSKKFTYTLPATCEGVEYVNGVGTKTLPNTAQIVETKQNSSQNVTVDCTQYGKLKVQKHVDWNGATPVPSQAFPIEVTGPDGFAQSFTLTDTQVITLTNLKPGSYTVTEGVMPAGYEQVSIVTSPVDVTPGATAAVVVNNRKLLGTVTVSKTAVPSFTREYQWTLDKSVTPSTLNLFEGEAALNANYTVSATVALTIDTGFRLKGAVTIANNGTNPALITSISDALSDSTAVALVCTLDGNALPLPLTSTLELGAGKSILCTYEHSFGDTKPAVTSNTASVQLTTGAPITGAAEFDFNKPTQKINESIDVKDMLEERATDKTWSYTTTQSGEQQKYSEPFNCAVEGLVYDANGKASYTRTNTVSSTTQGVTSTDQETVTVNCYRLVVTKTANTSYDNLYTWEISKTVDPTEVNMLQGQTQPLSYTVQVTRTGPFAQNFAVAGEITVVNPNPASAATGVVVTDKLVSGETPAPVCSSYDVPANGGSITCTYSTALSVGANTVNTATVAFLGKSYQGGAVVDFSKAAVTDINPSINVTDTNQAAPLGTEISESESFTYTLVATCDDAVYNEQTQRWEKVLPNTARIQQTGQTADANVQINCLKDGKIIIEKLTIPAGETQLFDFTTNFSPAFRLADGMTKSVPVMAGTYAITESLPITGWNLTDVRCVLVGTDTDPIPPAPSSVAAAPNPKSVTVGGGETWKCTFTNTKWGKLVVQKIAPDDTAKLFSFTGGVAGAIPHLGTLSADLQPGYYNVTEAVPAGWTLRGISPNCTQINDASVEGNGVNPTATAYVQPGLTTTCVFTNSLPSIAVIKTATPEKVPNPGADVVFNVSVKNTGKLDPVSITDLTDSIYGDITKVQGKVKATTCALGTTLQPGGVYACNFTAYVTTPSPTGQEYSETDVVTATGHTDFETQVSAHDDATVVVLAATAQLGDRVWLDRNPNGQSTPEKLAGDGLQNDPTEPGVGAVNVQLWGVGANGIAENGGGDDVLANAMATDAQGKYKFLTVTPGKYYLVFIKTPGPRAWSTLLNVGTDRTIDSDVKVDPADSNRAVTGVITVVPGTNDPTWDAAIVDTSGALSSDLGDLVWNDENKNGIQDAGEAGIPNIKVELFQVAQPTAAQAEAATAFATTTTSAAGVYNFRALDPGTYYVKVTVPADFTISPKNAGGDSTRDSDIDLTGRTANIVLPANTEDLTWDAGIFATPTVDEPSTEPQQPTATSVFLPTVLR